MRHKVCVYGTLRLGEGVTVQLPGSMYDLGSYPGIRLDGPPEATFTAEVVEVDEDTLARLDAYEGYSEPYPEHSLYIRKSIPLPGTGEPVWVYEYNSDDLPEESRIEEGCWLRHTHSHRGSACYLLTERTDNMDEDYDYDEDEDEEYGEGSYYDDSDYYGPRLVNHGGLCCGIKIICMLGYSPDSPAQALPAVPHNNNAANGDEVSSNLRFFSGGAPTETYGERVKRYIDFVRKRAPSHLIEITLESAQVNGYNGRGGPKPGWKDFLRRYKFKKVSEFLNSNSGNTVLVYHLKVGQPKKKKVVKDPFS